MKALYALEGGVAGAVAITLIHESIKKVIPQAPRMDLLGMSALSKGIRMAGAKTPSERKLYAVTLAGDLLSNALYYSFAGIGKKENAVAKGALLGLSAGLGAVLLPKPLGLPTSHSNRTLETKVMTVGLYVAGGIIAALVMKALDRKKKEKQAVWEHRLVTSSMA
jgi:prepilin signal peptidase PulO-like enzyme (type II secretory pathway)